MAKQISALRALVKVKDEYVMLTQGDPLPRGVAKDELDRLTKVGAIADTDKPTETPTVVVAALSDDELVDWVKAHDAAEISAEVGSDKELAGRMLAAEQLATKDKPRPEVAEALAKV